MAVTAASYLAGVALTAGAVLKASEQEALLSGPDYIRAGEPEGLTRRAGLALARRVCLAYGADPGAVTSPKGLSYEKVCRPYLDEVGAGDGPQVKLPFRGGQCAVTYLAESFVTSNGVESGPFAQQTVLGPMALINTEIFPTPGNPGFTTTRWTFRAGDGQIRTLQFGAGGGPNNAVQSFKIRRVDGLPDDCGNPEPDVVQPTPDPLPDPNPGPFVIAPDIDVDVDVTVNALGVAIINFGDGVIEIDPFGDDGGGGGGGRAPGDLGEPGEPVEGEDGDEVDGEAPEDKVLGGLILNFTRPPVGAREYVEGIFRAACYVYMGNADGLDLHPECSMLTDGQLILPEKDNLTKFRVRINEGFAIRVTPLFADPVN